MNKADPEKGPAPIATNKPRISPEDPALIARGKVVDGHGKPVRDALIEQQGAPFQNGGRGFGGPGWIDLIAVTNDQGEFEIAHSKPLSGAIVQVSPRGMATKAATIPTGAGRKTIHCHRWRDYPRAAHVQRQTRGPR